MGAFLHHSRRLAIALALGAVLAVPAAALAATGGGGSIYPRVDNHGTVVDIEGVTLNNKLMATIAFRVTCDELSYYDWDTGQQITTTAGSLSASGTLLQAQAHAIASATGYAGGDVTCDGSTVNHFSVQVLADTLPLKRGAALGGIEADIGAAGADEVSYGRSGPTTIKLR